MKAPDRIKNLLGSVSGWLSGEGKQEDVPPPPKGTKPPENDDIAHAQRRDSARKHDSRPPFVPPAVTPPSSARDSSVGRPDPTTPLPQPAGFKSRDDVEKLPGNPPTPSGGRASGIVQSSTEDTSYRIRNQVVDLVRERYIKYGETMAAAMLSRALTERGLHLVLEKIDLKTSGRAEWDHDQIERYIVDQGLEAFCHKVGIRFEAIEAEMEQRRQSRQRVEQLATSQEEIIQSGRSNAVGESSKQPSNLSSIKVRSSQGARKDGTGSGVRKDGTGPGKRKDGTDSAGKKPAPEIVPQKLGLNARKVDTGGQLRKKEQASPREQSEPLSGKPLPARPAMPPPPEESDSVRRSKESPSPSPAHGEERPTRDPVQRYLDDELESRRGEPPT